MESSQRRVGLELLVAGTVVLVAEHAHLADAGSLHAVAELQEQAGRRHQVVLDGRAAPGATVDGDALGREALLIEPAAGDGLLVVAEDPQGVGGVAGGHHHPVAQAEVMPLDSGPTLRLLADGIQRAHLAYRRMFSRLGMVWCLRNDPPPGPVRHRRTGGNITHKRESVTFPSRGLCRRPPWPATSGAPRMDAISLEMRYFRNLSGRAPGFAEHRPAVEVGERP